MQPIILKDSKEVKNVIIQVNLKKGQTMVLSQSSAWDNLAYILEGLGATVEQCINKGMDKKKVYAAIEQYMIKVLASYKIKSDIRN